MCAFRPTCLYHPGDCHAKRNGAGMPAVQVCVREHCIVDAKPENVVEDLRCGVRW